MEVVSETGIRTWIRPVNQWFYDAFGRLLATKDANGNVRANEYDAAGRLSKSKDAYGNATLYAYDALGNQRMTQNPLGYLTFKSYDRQNRVTGIGDYLPGTNGVTRERVLLQRYTLNQNGDRLSVTDALNYTALYDYDGRSQLLRSQTSMGVVMNYAYNAQGRKTLERYPRVTDESVPGHWETDHESGNQYWVDAYVDDGATPDRDGGIALVDQLTWEYDVFGRVVDHNNLAGRDFNYGYDAASGMQIAESTAVGTGEVGSKAITYYANGRVRDVVESDGTTFKYEYDAAGNRTLEETIMRDGSGALTHTITRTLYDSHNRIARVTQDDLSSGTGKRVFDLAYAYDAVGNRRQVKALSGYGSSVDAVPVMNTAPSAIRPVSEKIVRTGMTSQFALLFSDIFRDADQDALTLSIARSDNTALPAWLTVQHDPATGEIVFIAAPGEGDVNADITVRLTARETANAANVATTDFVVRVRTNTPPQLVADAEDTLRAKLDKPWSRELTATEYFSDPDVGDHLTLTVVDAATLPWAQVDTANPSVVRLTGTPTVAGTYWLQVRATDEKGDSVVRTFEIITAANAAPQVVAVPTPRDAILGREFGWTQALATVFTDLDGDALQVTASGMPAWMSFQYLIDQATPELKFAGHVPADELDGRVYAITLKAMDADGAVTTTTLNVTVCANRGPALVLPSGWTAPPLRVYDNYDVTIPIATLFADPEGDQIFVVAAGTPAWLNVSVDQNAQTIRFHGRPTSNAQAGVQSFQLIARDAEGLANTANVSMAVAVENAPVRNTAVALNDKTLSIGRTFSFVLPDGLFTDSDGDALTLEASIATQLRYFDRPDESYPGVWVDEVSEEQLPQWLTFNQATRTFSGVVPGDLLPQALHVRLRANDGRMTSGADAEFVGADGVVNDIDFLLNLQPFANTAPAYNGGLTNQTLVHGGVVDFVLPPGTFSEPDGDALTYSAQVQAGGSWVDIAQLGLTINADSGRITGTATNLTQSSFNARIHACDPQGMLSSPGTFTFGVTNTAPTATAIPNQSVGRNVAFNFAAAPFFSDVNGASTLTYTASGLPAGMTCSATGVVTGTPASSVT
ncbi:MAG: putative Ig domain-containing protein, partial [Lysobacter sp.]